MKDTRASFRSRLSQCVIKQCSFKLPRSQPSLMIHCLLIVYAKWGHRQYVSCQLHTPPQPSWCFTSYQPVVPPLVFYLSAVAQDVSPGVQDERLWHAVPEQDVYSVDCFPSICPGRMDRWPGAASGALSFTCHNGRKTCTPCGRLGGGGDVLCDIGLGILRQSYNIKSHLLIILRKICF